MRAKRETIPKLSSGEAERDFWASNDSSDYVDWSQASAVTLPNLKPALRTISLRLPESTIGELKRLANRKDVPYQSLIKNFLSERIGEELAGEK